MEREQFKVLVKAMKAVYAQPTFIPDQDAFNVWFALLGDLPYKQAELAVQKHMATEKFPPTIADIREKAEQITSVKETEMSELEAWAIVRKAIGRSNYYAEEEFEKLPEAMMALGSYIYASTVRDFYLKKSYYESSPEEKKAADESAGKLSSLHQMMIILHNSMKICNEPYDYNLVFNKNKGDALLKGYEVFEPYGWYFEDEEERQVLDGTSELYRKEKKE